MDALQVHKGRICDGGLVAAPHIELAETLEMHEVGVCGGLAPIDDCSTRVWEAVPPCREGARLWAPQGT